MILRKIKEGESLLLQKVHQPHQGVLVMGAPRRASFSRPSVSGQGLVRAAKLLSSR